MAHTWPVRPSTSVPLQKLMRQDHEKDVSNLSQPRNRAYRDTGWKELQPSLLQSEALGAGPRLKGLSMQLTGWWHSPAPDKRQTHMQHSWPWAPFQTASNLYRLPQLLIGPVCSPKTMVLGWVGCGQPQGAMDDSHGGEFEPLLFWHVRGFEESSSDIWNGGRDGRKLEIARVCGGWGSWWLAALVKARELGEPVWKSGTCDWMTKGVNYWCCHSFFQPIWRFSELF